MRYERISFRSLLIVEAIAVGLVLAVDPADTWLLGGVVAAFVAGLFLGAAGTHANRCSLKRLLHVHHFRMVSSDGHTIKTKCKCGDEVNVPTETKVLT